jgi:hypothetical protein
MEITITKDNIEEVVNTLKTKLEDSNVNITYKGESVSFENFKIYIKKIIVSPTKYNKKENAIIIRSYINNNNNLPLILIIYIGGKIGIYNDINIIIDSESKVHVML